MKAASKVMIWAILILLVSLALVLGLVLVLLAELYCSLFLRRRQSLQLSSAVNTNPSAAAASLTDISSFQSQTRQTTEGSAASPLSSFYAHGVLRAPRSFLFPAVSAGKDNVDFEKLSSQLPHCLGCQSQAQPSISSSTGHHVGILLFTSSAPSSPLVVSPEMQNIQLQGSSSITTSEDQRVSSSGKEHLVYISNPIYDNEASRVDMDTLFETPKPSSPLLQMGCSSGEEDDEKRLRSSSSPSSSASIITPPLTPMKKLPAEACSVSLIDARTSLATSGTGSDSITHNDGLSSSSPGSPCTSPSW